MAWLAVFVLISIHQVQKHQFQKVEKQLRWEEPSESCEKDWYPFGDKCYKIGGKRTTRVKWEEANGRCQREGGMLATINTKELQGFVATFLQLDVKENLWIGLNDRANETFYEWLDGAEVSYTPWEPNEPSGFRDTNEDCIEMVYLSKGKSGDWNDVECNNAYPFVCQKEKVKLIRKPPNPMFCSEDQTGWRLGASCYYLVPDRESWYEAEKFCQTTYQGHLVTIIDAAIEEFLSYVFRDYTEEVWIGIQMKEEWQQQWSSGWYVSYNNWEKDKQEFIQGTCVLRVMRKEWRTIQCTKKCSFICERSSISPPALKNTVENSVCPSEPIDWRDLGGDYCYYFSSDATNWFEAQFRCMRRGGSLASIHSQLESDVILPFMKHIHPAAFLGLYRQRPIDEDFTWADGTLMDFKGWDVGEPNSVDEHCGEMRHNTKWNDIGCGDSRGFVCSVKKLLPNATGHDGKDACPGGVTYTVMVVVLISAFLVAILLGVVVYCIRRERGQESKKECKPEIEPPLAEKNDNQRERYRPSTIVILEESNYEIMS